MAADASQSFFKDLNALIEEFERTGHHESAVRLREVVEYYEMPAGGARTPDGRHVRCRVVNIPDPLNLWEANTPNITVIEVGQNGRPKKGVKPFKVCALWFGGTSTTAQLERVAQKKGISVIRV